MSELKSDQGESLEQLQEPIEHERGLLCVVQFEDKIELTLFHIIAAAYGHYNPSIPYEFSALEVVVPTEKPKALYMM